MGLGFRGKGLGFREPLGLGFEVWGLGFGEPVSCNAWV